MKERTTPRFTTAQLVSVRLDLDAAMDELFLAYAGMREHHENYIEAGLESLTNAATTLGYRLVPLAEDREIAA